MAPRSVCSEAGPLNDPKWITCPPTPALCFAALRVTHRRLSDARISPMKDKCDGDVVLLPLPLWGRVGEGGGKRSLPC